MARQKKSKNNIKSDLILKTFGEIMIVSQIYSMHVYLMENKY